MKKTIKLLDLDCGHCADKIQNAVKKIDGVTSVSVNSWVRRWFWKRRTISLTLFWPKQKTLIKQIEPDVTVKA